MPKMHHVFATSLVLLATVVANKGFASDFYQQAKTKYQMRSLSQGELKPDTQKDKATIAMVYQPECNWCKKQGQWLAKAKAQCGQNINILLIGNNGNKRQLKRELKHFDQKIPAFQANRKMLTQVGGVKASPTTLVFNDEGVLLAKKRGYVEDSKLSDIAKIISQGQCNLPQ